jgi:hypothetical protein
MGLGQSFSETYVIVEKTKTSFYILQPTFHNVPRYTVLLEILQLMYKFRSTAEERIVQFFFHAAQNCHALIKAKERRRICRMGGHQGDRIGLYSVYCG